MYESEQAKEWKEAIIDFEPSNDQCSIRGGMTGEVIHDPANADYLKIKFYTYT